MAVLFILFLEKNVTHFRIPPSLKLSNPILHGTRPHFLLSKPSTPLSSQPPRIPNCLPPIRAMKSMQGRVVCSTNDKMVSVEVVRLATHPKYKRHVRKKKFQAHDPDNTFNVGDFVQLEMCKPISKTKTFLAVPIPGRNVRKKKDKEVGGLGIPLESQQQQEQQA